MSVYRNFNQVELDKQYNVRGGIPDYQDIFSRWSSTSAAFRQANRVIENVPYGSNETQNLDFFPAATAGRPLLVFIHGGYWQSLDKSDFSYIAEPYIKNDINVAVVNYRLAPSVGMDEIVADNRDALIWLYRNAEDLAFDKDKIFLSGHSAGGHLTATMVSTDWTAHGLPADVLKGACAISGLYDLEPIRLCYLNKAVGLTAEQVAAYSPARKLPTVKTPIILTVGGDESNEYHRLQAEYAALLGSRNMEIQIVDQADGHHFDAVDRLGDEENELGKAMLDLIRRYS
ncbi:MAG: alpha/beta hydrolase [Burkholderiaceae bacterium]|uniref:Alpha/beta hydrolase n=1 Tax=Herminiimonas contaminans TaxID=1111140 RepID=A0ABS0EPF4_9BURK|nr:alpha/beta hydrolase [Herminiimonas contaminans]MBF8176738.1 alpha/beta hydrolase [Herminiimonas contaminans]MBX9798759.1 alpha/beta hydrolase [Burkholderiaceae bacterium]